MENYRPFILELGRGEVHVLDGKFAYWGVDTTKCASDGKISLVFHAPRTGKRGYQKCFAFIIKNCPIVFWNIMKKIPLLAALMVLVSSAYADDTWWSKPDWYKQAVGKCAAEAHVARCASSCRDGMLGKAGRKIPVKSQQEALMICDGSASVCEKIAYLPQGVAANGQPSFVPDDQTRKRIIKEVYTGKYKQWYKNGEPSRMMNAPENIQLEGMAYLHCIAPYQKKMMQEQQAQPNQGGNASAPAN